MGFTPEAVPDSGPPAESGGGRWVFLFAIAVFASLAFLVVYSRFSEPIEQMGDAHSGVGTRLTVLQVEPFIDADRSVTLDDLAGRVTLVNFWGPWCPPCRMEMPHMVEIQEKYGVHDEFQFLSVVCGAGAYASVEEMRAETEKYRAQAKLGFPIFSDPEFTTRSGLEAALGNEPHSMSYPTTLVIDRTGSLAGIWQGYSAAVPGEITATLDRLVAAP